MTPPLPPNTPKRASFPTTASWSPDGRLALLCAVTRSGSETRSTPLRKPRPRQRCPDCWGQSDQHFVIYIYWSPAGLVPTGPQNAESLAYLIEEDDSTSLRLVELAAGRVDNRRVGRGRPLFLAGRRTYGAWSGILAAPRRHNEQAKLVLYDIERDHAEELPHPPGLFVVSRPGRCQEHSLAGGVRRSES